MTGIKAHLAVTFTHSLANLVDPSDPFWFFTHHVQGSQRSGGIRRWDAGAEDHRAGRVLDVVHHVFVTRDESAE